MILRWWISVLILSLWMCHTAVLAGLQNVDLSDQKLDRENFLAKLQYEINIREVEELTLRGNYFDVFLDCSFHLENLRTLDLSHNRLTKFFFLCQNELNLEYLNVSHNQIEYINDQALSEKTAKLKTLDVSYNDLYVVNDTMLQYMENLEFLSLASNPIRTELDDWVFGNLSHLRHLDLRNVSLGRFSSRLFSPLTSLEHLDLSDNPLESLPTELPPSLRVLYACGTNLRRLGGKQPLTAPRLRLLSLERSRRLDSLLLDDLTGLGQLEILSLKDSSGLERVKLGEEADSQQLPRLKQLDMSNCSLESIGPEILRILRSDARIELDGNPWTCDCRLGWILQNDPDGARELANAIRCRSPEELRDRLLRNLLSQDLECEDDRQRRLSPMAALVHEVQPLLPVMLAICALLGVLSAGLALGYRSRHRLGDCWASAMRRRRADESVSYTSFVESGNDLACILPVATNAQTGHRLRL